MKKIDKDKRRLEWLSQAGILTEALPYMRHYNDKILVIKYGGNAMITPELSKKFAKDIVLLKQVGIHPIIVHGGGPQINSMLKKLEIESEFIDGLRVTSKETIEVVEMVLSGKINKDIVASIGAFGGQAIGLSGKDASLLSVKKLVGKTGNDYGFVGEINEVNTNILDIAIDNNFIPVIAPIGLGDDGNSYNINADIVAGAIAVALKARRLLLLTDVAGVLDKNGKILTDISLDEVSKIKDSGIIKGGMIPKFNTCIDAVKNGVDGAVIIDGRQANSILLEIFTEHGSGTIIHK